MKKFQAKKALYVVLCGLTGMLSALVFAGVVEIMSYRIIDEVNLEVVLFATTMFIGIIGGLILGLVGWQKIYVEGVRGKKYVVK